MNKKNLIADKVSTKQPAVWSAFGQLILFIIDYAKSKGFEDQIVWELELIADEILTNIIRYAYPQGVGMIEVNCCYEASKGLVIEINDYGIPFSPLTYPTPDCTLDINSIQTNGFGIYIVRCLLDDIAYKREGNMNCLTLRKKTRAL